MWWAQELFYLFQKNNNTKNTPCGGFGATFKPSRLPLNLHQNCPGIMAISGYQGNVPNAQKIPRNGVANHHYSVFLHPLTNQSVTPTRTFTRCSTKDMAISIRVRQQEALLDNRMDQVSSSHNSIYVSLRPRGLFIVLPYTSLHYSLLPQCLCATHWAFPSHLLICLLISAPTIVFLTSPKSLTVLHLYFWLPSSLKITRMLHEPIAKSWVCRPMVS